MLPHRRCVINHPKADTIPESLQFRLPTAQFHPLDARKRSQARTTPSGDAGATRKALRKSAHGTPIAILRYITTDKYWVVFRVDLDSRTNGLLIAAVRQL